MRRYVFHLLDELRDILMTVRQVDAFVRRRLMRKRYPLSPCFHRSQWSRLKPAPTVRADITQNVVNTLSTERAFITTDAGFLRIRWQVFIAVFTVRFEY